MSYCINPDCPHPQNPDHLEHCQACGSSLVYDEFLYRAIKPLETQHRTVHQETHDTQLYEVIDEEGNRAVLKVLTNHSARVVTLFEQETKILRQLTHLGIPRFERTFTFTTSRGSRLRCLVMEKIEGQTLDQGLEKQIPLSEETALKWLKQLVEILYVVHQKGFLHQDIKPSNIMRRVDGQLVLLDFGNASDTVSAGYTPPEQADGKATPQSDFFALGRTFVHLLTGHHPIDLPKHPQTGKLLWHPYAPQISQALADLVDDLMAPLPPARPQTVQAILARINAIAEETVPAIPVSSAPKKTPQQLPSATTSPRRRLGMMILYSGLVLALGYAGVRWFQPVLQTVLFPSYQTACDQVLEDALSCGEESLFPFIPIPEKQQGIDKFKAGDYQGAVAWLEDARKQQQDDPETLIYLNNARLATQPTQPYTIAIVAPIKNSPELSTEILRGVAQAQTEINRQGIHGRGLRVIIADDANDSTRAQQVAEALVNRREILGVVGHYTSEMSLRTLDIYQAHQLVLISYGSTSTDLSPYGLKPGHVFFRTVPTTQITALALTSYLMSQSPQPQNVMVFYNPQSPYSRSLRDQFDVSIRATGGRIGKSIDLCQVAFNAGNILETAFQQGTTAIALFPDGRFCAASYPNVLTTIRANNRRHPMVASWVLSRADTLESVGEHIVGKLVFATPWHRLSSTNSSFLKEAEMQWGRATLHGEGINTGTATTYDATRALIHALAHPSKPNSRVGVQQVLAAPDFEAQGATGPIRFLGGDRQEPVQVLLKVVPSQGCNHYQYSFVPVHYPLAKEGILNCHTHSGGRVD